MCARFGVDVLIHHSEFSDAVAEMCSAAPTISATIALEALAQWASAQDQSATLTDPSPSHLAAVFATGGTTGAPKGVCYSHRTLSAIVGNYVEMIGPDPVFLAAGPLTHVSGRATLGVIAAGGHDGRVATVRRHCGAGCNRTTPSDHHRAPDDHAHPAGCPSRRRHHRHLEPASRSGWRVAGACRAAEASDHHPRAGDHPELRTDRSTDVRHVDATRRLSDRRSASSPIVWMASCGGQRRSAGSA